MSQDNQTIIIDGEEFGVDECNGSGRCAVSHHIHGCYADLGNCDEPVGHKVYA